ncbi:hypothetical protein L227DRAFT_615704 [Lentinus tigrinus ALCF2SS1-6]|uniref:BTB domain-containing protein n=1 Tax=Lentinus tigrinus ALCF2SS1-6 TaxID=1328759 RepID=A0A5C2RWC6_9APHY|nr:hypothetical protein L227DRAFT_615704 [Lentinus tigrinus ALCF2SS1-6]
MSAPYVTQQGRPICVPEPGLQKFLPLWFFDGNVVLVAQGVAFRVHQGVLAHHSTVFRSWFTGPNPVVSYGTVNLFEGVPMVWLRSTDTAYDLRQALFVMYGFRCFDGPLPVTFSEVAGLRRFALAYGMELLAEASRQLFNPVFPGDIGDWDAFDREHRLSFGLGDYQAIEAFNLIKLKHDGFYLAAVYFCAQLPVEVLREGTWRLDGTREVLSEEDMQIILTAKARLQELSAKVLALCSDTVYTLGEECDETGCEVALHAVMCPKGPVAGRLARGDAMSGWALDCIEELSVNRQICDECERDARERHEAMRKQVWKEFVEAVTVAQVPTRYWQGQ